MVDLRHGNAVNKKKNKKKLLMLANLMLASKVCYLFCPLKSKTSVPARLAFSY